MTGPLFTRLPRQARAICLVNAPDNAACRATTQVLQRAPAGPAQAGNREGHQSTTCRPRLIGGDGKARRAAQRLRRCSRFVAAPINDDWAGNAAESVLAQRIFSPRSFQPARSPASPHRRTPKPSTCPHPAKRRQSRVPRRPGETRGEGRVLARKCGAAGQVTSPLPGRTRDAPVRRVSDAWHRPPAGLERRGGKTHWPVDLFPRADAATTMGLQRGKGCPASRLQVRLAARACAPAPAPR